MTPKIYKIEQLIDWDINELRLEETTGLHKWRPARPLTINSLMTRLKATWLVLTGQADAVVWSKQ